MALALSSPSTCFFSHPKTLSFFTSKRRNPIMRAPAPLTIKASSSQSIRLSPLPPMKIVRCPALDRRAAKHSKLRFVRKLKTLLLSKPKHFLPLRVLSRCRAYLNPPPSHSLLKMIKRYPALFRLFYAPSHTSPSLSLLSVTLTPAAAALAADEANLRARLADALATKLQRLLMLAPRHSLLLSKLVHLAPDLGLAPNFRSRLCNAYPSRFRTVDTSYGRALELVDIDHSIAVPLPPLGPFEEDPLRRPIIDRPPRFPQLRLRRGLNLRRRHRDYLIRFQDLPEVNPYSCSKAETAEMEEKRACAVVREVVGMTTEKRTLVDHLTHFRKDFGLTNRLRALLLRHPEMFYVSIKGARDSVFLVEAYDDKGRLLVPDELTSAKQRLANLVREGKRMRKEWRRGIDCVEEEEDEDEEEDDDDEDDDDNDFDILFEGGIGDDWEEFKLDEGTGAEEDMTIDELWVKRTASSENISGHGMKTDAW